MLKITVAEVGDVGIVKTTGKLGTGLWMHNDVGGSCELPPGVYRVKVTKAWDDYETGQRCIGKLLDPKDIETARKTGTIDVSKYPANVVEQARERKAKTSFDPSIVYFQGTQLEADTTPKTPKKPKGDAAKGYMLKGVKVFQGMDGVGLNATLLRDGKPVCTLIDEGCGGEMLFRWHDHMRGESNEHDLWDAFIAGEKAKVPADKKLLEGHDTLERDVYDGSTWVNKEVDRIENDKRFRRLCKTKIVFQVGEKIGSDEFQSIKGVQFRAHIEKMYAGQKIKFLNDEV